MDDEEQKSRVKALFQQALQPAEKPIKSPQIPGKTVIINGDWHNYAPPRAKVVVLTPWAVITKAQKHALVRLRDQWVAMHNASQARQLARSEARKALNDQAGVTAHRLIPAHRYADLIAWLGLKMANLEAHPAMQAVNIQRRRCPPGTPAPTAIESNPGNI